MPRSPSLLPLLATLFVAACGDGLGPSWHPATPSLAVGIPNPPPCTVSIAPVPGGNTTVVKPDSAVGLCGRWITVQAFPNAGYAFHQWLVRSGSVNYAPSPVGAARWALLVDRDYQISPVFVGAPPACDLLASKTDHGPWSQSLQVTKDGKAFVMLVGCSTDVWGIAPPTNLSFVWGPVFMTAGQVLPGKYPPQRGYGTAGTYRYVAGADTLSITVTP